MILQLKNCHNENIGFDIGELDTILDLTVRVISGDEVLYVIRTDWSRETYDSDTHGRYMDFMDAEYTIYNQATGLNELDKWALRKDSNDWEGG